MLINNCSTELVVFGSSMMIALQADLFHSMTDKRRDVTDDRDTKAFLEFGAISLNIICKFLFFFYLIPLPQPLVTSKLFRRNFQNLLMNFERLFRIL